MLSFYDLPTPNKDAIKRSLALTQYLKQEIDQYGALSFNQFMQAALYHPQWGYYNAPTFTLGKQGDFTTAAEMSPLYAQCFSTLCCQLFETPDFRNILEIGAGSGRFAYDLLSALEKKGCIPTHYYIYEISSSLRKKQQDFLRKTCPLFYKRILWLEKLPQNFSGFIIANEVLDALPVQCFYIENEEIKERKVTYENDQFTWEKTSPTTSLFTQEVMKIRQHCKLPQGYASEINLHLRAFIHPLAACLSQGVILFADYGYGQKEYYHLERHLGTMTCFYQHRRHNNPLILPGLQDITAHVDFTRVVDCAIQMDCALLGYTTQAGFLLDCGLMDYVTETEKHLNAHEQFTLHQIVKQLTLPTEMGECIKMMALSKKIEGPLVGFGLQDRRRDL